MGRKVVRGHARGLGVLRALNECDFQTALEISRATGLARTTVYRMLDTLVEAGYVRAIGDRFCLSSEVQHLAKGFREESLALEVAHPIVERFSMDIGWPAYVYVLDGNAMVARQIVHSPRALTEPRLGSRVSVLCSSPGRAYLALLPPERRTAFGAEAGRLAEAARDHGCGFRDQGFLPRTCSVALPVKAGERPLAFVTAVFMRSVVPVERAIETYVPAMRECVFRIEHELARVRLTPK